MKFLICHNQNKHILTGFKEAWLVFFADKSKRGDPNRFSPEYRAYLKEFEAMEHGTHAQKIAEKARQGKIEPEVLKQVREVLRDPNKMQRNEYKYFMKALGEGKFPDRAKNALRFLQALSGTGQEKEYAKEFLRDLSEESTQALSQRKEKDTLKRLTELREEDLAKETVQKTASSAETMVTSASISSLVEKASEITHSNWHIENPPEGLCEKLDELERAQIEIAQKSNEIDRQYRIAKAEKKPDDQLINRLKQELIRLDDEFDKLQRELSRPREEYRQYLARNLARYRALNEFFKRAGVDVKTAERIRMWFLDLTRGAEARDKKASLKLLGIKIDPTTGKAKKQETTIEIRGLRFEKDHSGYTNESPGELIIEYIDEKGETCAAGYKNFLQIINTFEGYEEIDSLDELNKRAEEQLGYKEIAVGDEFETEVLLGFDDEGKKIKEKQSFTIESVDNKKKTVRLSRSVKKIPRQWIQFSVHSSLYFDRNGQEFSFGEFAKLLKQHNFERKVNADETETICERASASLKAQCQEFAKGSSERLQKRFERLGGTEISNLTLPKPSARREGAASEARGFATAERRELTKTGEEKEVLFLDNSGLLRWGRLKREEDKSYHLHEIPDKLRESQIEDMLKAGVPGNFAYADRSNAHWPEEKLAPLTLARMVREGKITNAPSTKKTHNGKWQIVNEPEKIAAMEIANKSAVEQAETPLNPANIPHEPEQNPEIPHEKHDEHDKHDNETHDEHGEHDAHDHKKAKYYEEALPIDAVKKAGGMTKPEHSFLKALWNETRFLSIDDFWQWGKACYEYYDRRFERRQKDKFARVGEEMPYFAPEMRRVVEATEHEQVHQFQEAFEHKGIYEVQYRLERTSNRDEFKAAFVTLSDKGQLRWDSIDLWRNINRFVKPDSGIPIPSNGDPYTCVSSKDYRTGFDFLKPALDSLWGEGTYDGWYSKNKSTFASSAKGFYEEGKQVEGLDGGHERRLSILLKQHKNGIYVNPHEYEGLILHSIEYGKSDMQSKIYYMIEGVAAANHEGRTIMAFDRIAHINSEMLSQFPILEYITKAIPRAPRGEKYAFTLDDYKQWVNWFDDGHPADPAKNRPGKAVDDFMWRYVIPSDETQNRINKALRNGEKLDHDDMFAYLPPATEEVVTDACRATTGSKKFLTVEGYANVFPGFSQYMRSVADGGRRSKLREAIKSYVRFEGIMTNRFEQEKDSYQRLSYSTLNSATIVSDIPPQAFIDQTNATIKEIIAAYNNEELNAIAAIVYQPRVDDYTTDEGRREQNKVNKAFKDFGDVFNKVVKSDNGEKMEAIIRKANMIGMTYKDSAEKARRKGKFADKLAIE